MLVLYPRAERLRSSINLQRKLLKASQYGALDASWPWVDDALHNQQRRPIATQRLPNFRHFAPETVVWHCTYM